MVPLLLLILISSFNFREIEKMHSHSSYSLKMYFQNEVIVHPGVISSIVDVISGTGFTTRDITGDSITSE